MIIYEISSRNQVQGQWKFPSEPYDNARKYFWLHFFVIFLEAKSGIFLVFFPQNQRNNCYRNKLSSDIKRAMKNLFFPFESSDYVKCSGNLSLISVYPFSICVRIKKQPRSMNWTMAEERKNSPKIRAALMNNPYNSNPMWILMKKFIFQCTFFLQILCSFSLFEMALSKLQTLLIYFYVFLVHFRKIK